MLSLPAFGLYRKVGQGFEPLAQPFRVQDECCAWHVERASPGPGGGIRRISFTCEPLEYGEFLAERDFDLVSGSGYT